MKMLSVDFTESRENKTKSSNKMLPPVGIEPMVADFHAMHATV